MYMKAAQEKLRRTGVRVARRLSVYIAEDIGALGLNRIRTRSFER